MVALATPNEVPIELSLPTYKLPDVLTYCENTELVPVVLVNFNIDCAD